MSVHPVLWLDSDISLEPAGLTLDLRIREDEGDAFTFHSRADAQGFQVFEKRIVVVGLCNGDPRAPAA